MSTEVKVPMLPESVSEASMLTWHKNVGDSVTQGEILVDLETDKVVLEVPAPQDGTILEIQKNAGDIVTADDVIAILGSASEQPAAATEAAPSTEATSDEGASVSTTVKVPMLPESVSEASIQAWHKNVGDAVTEGENLVDLETDKVVLEVPATATGVLQKIISETGSVVTADDMLGVITSGAASSAPAAEAPAQQSAPAATSSDFAAKTGPAARHLMSENNVDVKDVNATGNNGTRITKEDVVNHINTPKAAAQPVAQAPQAASAQSSSREETRQPMTRIRQTIAKRLVQSQHETAMLTTFNEVDLTAVMDLRKKYKDSFQDKHGVKLGFMSFFAKAAAEGLKKFPMINAYVDGTDVLLHNYCDIGIAVSSPRGLVVPVVRNCEEKSFAEIESDIVGYGQKAKKGTLSMDEMTGGTFTITNGGIFGSLVSTPIINPPQSAILGMHAIKERPMVVNGEIVARPMMYLALSYDHRIVDGAEAVQFLVSIKDSLEDPGRLLLSL